MNIMCIQFNDLVNTEVIELEEITREKFYPVQNNNNSILKPKYTQLLQDIIVCRDNPKNVMSIDEAIINMISQIYQCFNCSKFEQHWNYLVSNKNLSNLKACGKVKISQTTC